LGFHVAVRLLTLGPVLVRFSKWTVVLMLTLSLGTPWTFLQSIAWVRMVVKYSQSATLSEALVRTFDGKHPCGLCKWVQRGKAEEKKQDPQKPETKPTKIDQSLPTGVALAIYPLDSKLRAIDIPDRWDSRADPPPTPPPKRA
jgi:hypothetical protein